MNRSVDRSLGRSMNRKVGGSMKSTADLVHGRITDMFDCRTCGLLDNWTGCWALGFPGCGVLDGWIAGLLGLWGDGLILCLKAHCFNASDGINGFNSCERRGIGRI